MYVFIKEYVECQGKVRVLYIYVAYFITHPRSGKLIMYLLKVESYVYNEAVNYVLMSVHM